MKIKKQGKKNALKTLFFMLILLGTTFLFSTCKKADTTTPPPCSNAGTSVNIGGSAGSYYYTQISSSSGSLKFDNTNLNFSIVSNQLVLGTIIDAGTQTCPAFSYSGTPSATLVAYKLEHGYEGIFPDGHIVKFVTTSYSGGVALIAYIYQ